MSVVTNDYELVVFPMGKSAPLLPLSDAGDGGQNRSQLVFSAVVAAAAAATISFTSGSLTMPPNRNVQQHFLVRPSTQVLGRSPVGYGVPNNSNVSIFTPEEYTEKVQNSDAEAIPMLNLDAKKIGVSILIVIAIAVLIVSLTNKRVFSPVGSTFIVGLSLLGAYAFGKDDRSTKGRS